MPISRNVRKAVMISAAVFAGLMTTAFAAYVVYENRENIPIIRDFFEDEVEPVPGREYAEVGEEQEWTISIEDGNVVKTFEDGSETVLVDKDDYDDVEKFSNVAVSPDRQHMCFLSHALVPVWLTVSDTDGENIKMDLDLAENCYWSNDSSMVAFTNHTTDVSQHDVHVYFLDTEELTNFTRDLSTEHVMRIYKEPAWSDDDTTITSQYNAYDDRDDWAQSTGFTIITIATGETRDVASPVDTTGWNTHEDDASGLSLLYPPGWTADEDCTYASPGELCSIKVTDGDYIWRLDFDPFVTGGGFGFLFDQVTQPATAINTVLSVDGYDPTLVTNYYDSDELAAEMDNDTFPPETEVWGWSVTFTEPNNYDGLGFGPGAMYDSVENNFWSITYQYEMNFPNEGAKDFSELPVKNDPDLEEAFQILNAISESLDLP